MGDYQLFKNIFRTKGYDLETSEVLFSALLFLTFKERFFFSAKIQYSWQTRAKI
ncbi:hypothetical protein IX332_001818 [Porphyromonas levii]|nr:hypothetical protein [Porphyromonas levii]MBR8730474.1 hypothetical protein [Porphyromonas levii]MBR8764138.1 hypothetical protein [Porphyromonas levii]MBR8766492.1 hypothetical protein [Porphyromonas levii]MBR8770395.1 hypothetical protein [Porphyromonas levii]